MNLTKLAAVGVYAFLAVSSAQAITVTLGVGTVGPYILGDVIPGADYGVFGGQAAGDVAMVNTMIPIALGGTASPLGQQSNPVTPTVYNRSLNPFSPLPLATTAGNTSASGGGLVTVGPGGTFVELTLGTGFTYLVAKWDGPNGGAEVYDIAALSAGTVIDIPQTAFDHGMTGWTLLDGTTPRIPDGGTTVLLLGTALSGLGLIRRKLS